MNASVESAVPAVCMHAERVTPLPVRNAMKWLCLVILARIGASGSAG